MKSIRVSYLSLGVLLLLFTVLNIQTSSDKVLENRVGCATEELGLPAFGAKPSKIAVAQRTIQDAFRFGGKKRKIAWLLSFPNSGTSFTGKVIRDTSQRATATNYGAGNLGPKGVSIPLDKNHPDGPFWVLQMPLLQEPESDSYILTKTHCGSRCNSCTPDRYIETPSSFLRNCLKGTKVTTETVNGEKKQVTQDTTYPKEIIDKAIHLIRDPFDNIVSRFHLEVHQYLKHNNSVNDPHMAKTREGFRKFCNRERKNLKAEEKRHWHFHYMVPNELKSVPCYADFFRWVQWHNLAIVMTQDMNLTTHYLHYESFNTDFDETLDGLLSFLDLKRNGMPTPYYAGEPYRSYFEEDEIKNITKAMKELSLSRTWELIHHYF